MSALGTVVANHKSTGGHIEELGTASQVTRKANQGEVGSAESSILGRTPRGSYSPTKCSMHLLEAFLGHMDVLSNWKQLSNYKYVCVAVILLSALAHAGHSLHTAYWPLWVSNPGIPLPLTLGAHVQPMPAESKTEQKRSN